VHRLTGTSYGIIVPLTNGVTSIVDEGDFEVARRYRILENERITVWYTAPTAIRMRMEAATDSPAPTSSPPCVSWSSVGRVEAIEEPTAGARSDRGRLPRSGCWAHDRS
jgi:acetyl-CoA synthetase